MSLPALSLSPFSLDRKIRKLTFPTGETRASMTTLRLILKRPFYAPGHYPPVGGYYAPCFAGGYYLAHVNPYFYG
ncbi:hypothetical protein L596_021676 [Steinernema carpocapsae]|uniref:Uncharacterized protein n=1 Tax=Steinernema carpocapsae TaxID=34508 RepID=A0A4U5MJJ9_STECR|nr:hypothetical protein L596_021676 [Steinernema carpocapsae]